MNILVLGADGFIGRHLAFGFSAAGHDVVASARRTKRLERMGLTCLKADLSRSEAHSPEYWKSKVIGITHVVNAAGLLNGSDEALNSVHIHAPKALYEALPKDTPIVLISAISIDQENSAFARIRVEGEKLVHQFKGMALRPGLVLGDTSYGGSSLGRAVAAMPWVTPLIDGGHQEINPIHAEDFTQVALELLEAPKPGQTFEIGGREIVTQAEMLEGYRAWLGLPKGRKLNVPRKLANSVGRLGDALKLGPISSTFLAMLDAGAVAKTSPEIQTPLRGFTEFVWHRPAGTQDIWHARLYFLAHLARLALALLWLGSGLVGVFYPAEAILSLPAAQDLPDMFALALARGGGLIDLLIGLAVFRGWHPKLWGLVQLGMVLAYTLGLTVLDPALWALPFGGVLKNLPILVIILIHMIFAEER